MPKYYVGGALYSGNDIWHHGIKGQEWGVRNGPPYPLGSGDHSEAEVRAAKKRKNIGFVKTLSSKSSSEKEEIKNRPTNATTKTSSSNSKGVVKNFNTQDRNPDGTFNLHKILGLETPEEIARAKAIAKTVGISLGTVAGVMAVSYLMSKSPSGINLKNITSRGVLDYGYNASGYRNPYKVKEIIKSGLRNGEYIGAKAKANGYSNITGADIVSAIKNRPTNGTIDFDNLIRDVRLNQIGIDSRRRLSCWSTSQGYFMSAMTGKDFASMSFENLVDFNDFGTLYKKMPEIFSLGGSKMNDFVGHFGDGYARADLNDGKLLVKSIFKNISSKNNLAIDGKTTLGFINAGYHGTTCTHEWNFEIFHGDGLEKILNISDGYSGERYSIAKLVGNKITYSGEGMKHFMEELHHYNSSSIRFYAPSLDSIDPDALAKIIIGKL